MSPLENYLLRAYLDGELDELESEAFELLMLERPDIAAMVEADCALQMGLSKSAEVSDAGDVADMNTEQPRTDVEAASSDDVIPIARGKRGVRGGFLPLAMAASVALAVGLGAGTLIREPVDPLRPATLAYVDKLRDIAATPKLRLPAAGAVVLMVPVPSIEPCLATVAVSQGDSVAMSAEAMPDEFSYVSLVMSRESVALGEAQVDVSCDGKLLGEYDLLFVAKDG